MRLQRDAAKRRAPEACRSLNKMKHIFAITFALLAVTTVCTATTFIRIRLGIPDNPNAILLNDKPVTDEKLSSIMDRLAAIDTNQHVIVQITPETRAADLLPILIMLSQKGLNNLVVNPINDSSSITQDTRIVFTLWPSMAHDLRQFHKDTDGQEIKESEHAPPAGRGEAPRP